MNNTQYRGKFVTLDLRDIYNKSAIGTTVLATIGEKRISFPVQSSWSYMAANNPRIHIGLGQENSITDVEVFWSDGTRSTYDSFDFGFHVIHQQVQ